MDQELTNPFRFGQTVENTCFFDRIEEQEILKNDFLNSQNLILIAPRRYGKSSLIKKVLADLQQTGVICIYCDLFLASSLDQLINVFARSFAAAIQTPLQKIGSFLKEWAPRLKPTVVIRGDNLPELSLDWEGDRKESAQTLADFVDLTYRYSKKKQRKVVIAFDEFQEILEWGDVALLKQLRALIQSHENISYCFAGSQKHLLSEIFLTKASPFFNFGKILSLKKIPWTDFSHFLANAFQKTDLVGCDDRIKEILTLTQCHPHYTQMFAYQLWETVVHQKVKTLHLQNVIDQIIRFQQDAYMSLWNLLTQRQKKLLIGLAHDESRPLTQAEVVSHWNLGSPATVIKVLKALDREGFIEQNEKGRAEIVDPFFKIWIRGVS